MRRRIAAVDVGSNAVRLAIAEVNGSPSPRVIESVREPVRLGGDVFGHGDVSPRTLRKLVEAFHGFQERIEEQGVREVRAVGTSALREARNRDAVIAAVERACGIPIRVIPSDEEARLVCRAVTAKVDLDDTLALVVDIGGGSVELALLVDGRVAAIDSLDLGTVRLLGMTGTRGGAARCLRIVAAAGRRIRGWLRREAGEHKVGLCFGTGGNAELLGELRRPLLEHKGNSWVTREELAEMARRLRAMPMGERVRKLGLRPDRADVVYPAAVVLETVLRQAQVPLMLIPRVGLKDGVLAELAAGAAKGRAGRRATRSVR